MSQDIIAEDEVCLAAITYELVGEVATKEFFDRFNAFGSSGSGGRGGGFNSNAGDTLCLEKLQQVSTVGSDFDDQTFFC